jgi:acetyltransferase-like isoleucine patch superfamily enzyme
MADGDVVLPGDWFGRPLPANVELATGVYIDSSYTLDGYRSRRAVGLRVAAGAGIYDRAQLVVGPDGLVDVGAFSCLNGTTVIATDEVRIGRFCLLSWSVVITDTPFGVGVDRRERRRAVLASAADPERPLPAAGRPAPVVLEDNTWVGFGAVVGPGVRIGRGAVVGCRSVVTADVEPFTVVAGDPALPIARLEVADEADVGPWYRSVIERAARDEAAPPGVRAVLTGFVATTRRR